MLTHEEKQIHNAVHAELREFEEFKELVKKMREAQMDANDMLAQVECYQEAMFYVSKAEELEKEVDEYLKKMEI